MKGLLEENRTCVFCGRELTGRLDKKFCDDICRNNYAYRRNKHNDEIIKKTNKTLLHNRNILKSISECRRKIVKKQLLVDNDFDFDVITGVYKTHRQYEYKMLYDYAYRCINDEEVLILKCC